MVSKNSDVQKLQHFTNESNLFSFVLLKIVGKSERPWQGVV